MRTETHYTNFPRRRGYPLWVAARMALMVYAGLTLFLAVSQRRVMYYPARAPAPEQISRAAANGCIPWRDADGGIIGWRPGPRDAEAPAADVLLVFHGNAGSALDRLYLTDGFAGVSGGPEFSVYLFEYPGYGARPGRPSEAAFQAAADDAFRQLREAFPDRRIYVAGESLGSGVATALAGRHPEAVSGLFLITAFSSMTDVARHHYPYLPVRLLLRDRYESIAPLQHYRGPVAILLAEHDEVVPARFGRRLFDAYRGPKRLWVQERHHNTLDYRPDSRWWGEVAAFLADGLPNDRQ